MFRGRVRGILKNILTGVLVVAALGFLYGAQTQRRSERVYYVSNSALADPVVPERVALTWAGDPKDSFSVTWRTSTPTEMTVGEIAPCSANPSDLEEPLRVEGKCEVFKTPDGITVQSHTVGFSGLEAGTRYAYRVGDGQSFTEWTHVRTASADPEPFSFVFLGDAQNHIHSLWSRSIREAFREEPDAAFILHGGDLVNNPISDSEWEEWFRAGSWILSTVPSLATPGNHEYYDAPLIDDEPLLEFLDVDSLTPYWKTQFAFPENGPEGLAESAYYVDYQGVRIISLNSNERFTEQSAWLRQILSDNPNKWTIVAFHHPVFSPSESRQSPEIQKYWKPLFDEFGVDLVLNGHDHTYARSGKIYAGQQVGNDQTGTVYAISVSGPKMYDFGEAASFYRRTAGNAQLYQIIKIDGDVLTYKSESCAYEVFDEFQLVKNEIGASTLIESEDTFPYPEMIVVADRSVR